MSTKPETTPAKSAPSRPAEPRRVLMIAYTDVQVLDITGPLEILASVNDARANPRLWAPEGLTPQTDDADTPSDAYEITIAAAEAGPFRTTSGLQLVADIGFADLTDEYLSGLHTLVVPGGEGTIQAMRDEAVLDVVARAGAAAERITSVCTGTFILARAGLIDGRRVTTHWNVAGDLDEMFPTLTVDADSIYVRDGNVWTSAGVTAGMDLALALVEEDCGRDMALAVARRHVLFMIRPGGQSQFSAQLVAQHAAKGRIGEITQWVLDNVAADLSVPALAERAHMSERTLARAFVSETGLTPGRFVEVARVEAARRHLEETADDTETIAWACGFSSAEQMRRAFHRRVGVSPADYRARFRRMPVMGPHGPVQPAGQAGSPAAGQPAMQRTSLPQPSGFMQ
ncbi:GlxA family transcriptional regulator [Pyruvatibacter mobilis]|uniref:GlxA family transcriptional regulator n=1 Tax=Pyruvatibacter mobilis TaxID=1712261 RepID=UPI003BAD62FC